MSNEEKIRQLRHARMQIAAKPKPLSLEDIKTYFELGEKMEELDRLICNQKQEDEYQENVNRICDAFRFRGN